MSEPREYRRGDRAAGRATRQIVRNIQHVATASSEINSHIGGVTTAAVAAATAASDVLASARELDNQSGMLRDAVDDFLAEARSANVSFRVAHDAWPQRH
jgi:methyl-accepting chemotaxis protein